jgi:UDPglucose 6-dehydrogenase
VINESTFEGKSLFNSRVVNELSEFKSISDVIATNRLVDKWLGVAGSVYTIDLFGSE